MDKLVYEILLDCWSVIPPLERNEIAQHVIDHVSEDIRKEVYASLQRMVGNGRIGINSEDGGQPRRYYFPPGIAGRH